MGAIVQCKDFNDQEWKYGELVDSFKNGYAVRIRMKVPKGINRSSSYEWTYKILFVNQVTK